MPAARPGCGLDPPRSLGHGAELALPAGPEPRREATAGSGPKRLEGREGEDSRLSGRAGAPVETDSKETDGIHQD